MVNLNTQDGQFPSGSTVTPLARFSLQSSFDELERVAMAQTPLLGRVAVLGQSTIFYAAPNTGKTLLTLHLLTEAVISGRINPASVFYANMDDTGQGLLEKLKIVSEYGFHIGASGWAGFDRHELIKTMREMIAARTAAGTVVVLDTLKKFVNLMDKTAARQFTTIVRDFVQLGGTVIALAHTNKNPGANGRSIYSGVADFVDDFDCAYVIERIQQTLDGSKQIVMFDNIKSRGSVVQHAAYSFAKGGDPSYAELFASVEEVDPEQWKPFHEAAKCLPDANIIEAVQAAIESGVTGKMLIAAEVRKLTNVSRQAAVHVIEKYATAGDPAQRWTIRRGRHGVQIYELLPSVTSTA